MGFLIEDGNLIEDEELKKKRQQQELEIAQAQEEDERAREELQKQIDKVEASREVGGPAVEEEEAPGLVTKDKIIDYGVKIALEKGLSHSDIMSIGDEGIYQQMIDKYPGLKEEQWDEPDKWDILELAKVFQAEQYRYAMPAYVSNLFDMSDEASNLDQQGISGPLKDLIFEQSFISQYKEANPFAPETEAYAEMNRVKEGEESRRTWAARTLEAGNESVDKAFKENPRLQATAEWLHDQKLRNFEENHWAHLFITTMPSLMTAMGTGWAFGKAGAGLGGLIAGPKGAIALGTAGYFGGAFIAGNVMEGGNYLQAGVDYLIEDREIPWDDMEEQIKKRYDKYTQIDPALRKEFFEKHDDINSMLYQTKIDPEGQKQAIGSISTTYIDENGKQIDGPGPYHGDLPIHEQLMNYDEYRAFQLYNYFRLLKNPDGTINREKIVQEGFTTEQAIDLVEASALSYGIFSGLVESAGDFLFMGMGTKAYKALLKNIDDKMALGIFHKISDRLSDVSASAPRGSNYFQRAVYNAPETAFRTLGVSTGEAVEEGVQYPMEVATTVYGPGFVAPEARWKFKTSISEEWSWKEWKESMAGGLMAGSPIGTMNLYSKVRRNTDRGINRQISEAADKYEGTYVWAPEDKNENGKYGINYAHSESEDVIELTDGTILRGTIVKKGKEEDVEGMTYIDDGSGVIPVKNSEIKDMRSELSKFDDRVSKTDILDKDGNPIAVEYDTWGEAYDAAKDISKSLHRDGRKETAWEFSDIVDGEAKVELDTEKGSKTEGKYVIKVYDNSGLLQFQYKAFATEKEANIQVRIVNDRIEEISKDHKEFGGNKGLENDPAIQKIEEENDRKLEESGALDSPFGVNSTVIAIKKFMNRKIRGVHRKQVRDIIDNEFPNLLNDDGTTILDIVEDLKKQGQWDIMGVGEEEFKETFEMFFKPEDKDMSPEQFEEAQNLYLEKSARLNDLFVPPEVPITPADKDIIIPKGEYVPSEEGVPIEDIPTPPGKPVGGRKSIDIMNKKELESYIEGQQKSLDEMENKKSADALMIKAGIKAAKTRLSKVIKDEKKKPKIIVEKKITKAEEIEIQIEKKEKDIAYSKDLIEKIKKDIPYPLLDKKKRDQIKKQRELIKEDERSIKQLETELEIEKQKTEKKAPEDKELRERRISESVDGEALSDNVGDEYEGFTLEEIKEGLKQKLEMLVEKFKIKGMEPFKYKIYDTWNEGVNALFKKRMGLTYPGPARDEQGRILKVGGWYDPETNTIVVIADSPNAGILPFHEFSHPFFESIAKENPELFQRLWNSIKDDPAFQSILEAVYEGYEHLGRGKIIYDEKTGLIKWTKEPTNAFIEEVFAHIMEGLANDRYNKKPDTFMDKVKAIWNAIKQWFFGSAATVNIYASKLSPDTTLNELAEILAEHNNAYTITLEDYSTVSDVLDVVDETATSFDEHGRDIQSIILNDLSNEDIITNSVLSDVAEYVDSDIVKFIEDIIDIKVDDKGKTFISSSKIRKHLPKNKSWNNLTEKQKVKVIESLLKQTKKDMDALVLKTTEFLAKKYHVSSQLYKGKKYLSKAPSLTKWGTVFYHNFASEFASLVSVIRSVAVHGTQKKEAPYEIDINVLNQLGAVISAIENQVSFRYSFIDKHLSRLDKSNPDRKIPIKGLHGIGGMHKQGQQRSHILTRNGSEYTGVIQSQDDTIINIKLDYNAFKKVRKEDIVKISKVKMPSQMSDMVKEFESDFIKKYPKIKSLLPSEIIALFQDWADNKYPLYHSVGVRSTTSLSYRNLINLNGIGSSIERVEDIVVDANADNAITRAGLDENSVYRILLHDGKLLQRGHQFKVGENGLTGNGFGWYTVMTVPNGIEGTVGDVFLYEYQSDFFPEAKNLWNKFNITLNEFLEDRIVKVGVDKDLDSSLDDIVRVIKSVQQFISPEARSDTEAYSAAMDSNKWNDPWRFNNYTKNNFEDIEITIPKEVEIDGKIIQILTEDVTFNSSSNPSKVFNELMIRLTGLTIKEHRDIKLLPQLFSDPKNKPLLEWILSQDLIQSLKVEKGEYKVNDWLKDAKRGKDLNHYEVALWYPYLHKVIDAILLKTEIKDVEGKVTSKKYKDSINGELKNDRIRAANAYQGLISKSLAKSIVGAFKVKDNKRRQELYDFIGFFQNEVGLKQIDNNFSIILDMKNGIFQKKHSKMKDNYFLNVVFKKMDSIEAFGYSMNNREGHTFIEKGIHYALEPINNIVQKIVESSGGETITDLALRSNPLSILESLMSPKGVFKNKKMEFEEVKISDSHNAMMIKMTAYNEILGTIGASSWIDSYDETLISQNRVEYLVDLYHRNIIPKKIIELLNEFNIGNIDVEIAPAGKVEETALHHISAFIEEDIIPTALFLEDKKAKKTKIKGKTTNWQNLLYAWGLNRHVYPLLRDEANEYLSRARKYKGKASTLASTIEISDKIGFDVFYDGVVKKDIRIYNRVYLKQYIELTRFVYDEVIRQDKEFVGRINKSYSKNAELFSQLSPGNPYAYDKYRDVEKALKWEKNFHAIQIMHSIVHGQTMLGPDGSIYLNTASAISLLERNDDAANIYADNKEIKWLISKDIMHKTKYSSRAANLRFGRNYKHYIGNIDGDFYRPNPSSNTGFNYLVQDILTEKIRAGVDNNIMSEELNMFFSTSNKWHPEVRVFIDKILNQPYYHNLTAKQKFDIFVEPYMGTDYEKGNSIIEMLQAHLKDMYVGVKQTGIDSKGNIGLMKATWAKEGIENPAFLKIIEEIFTDNFVTAFKDSVVEAFSTARDRIKIIKASESEGYIDVELQYLQDMTFSLKFPYLVSAFNKIKNLKDISIDELSSLMDPGLLPKNTEEYIAYNVISGNTSASIKSGFKGVWVKSLDDMKGKYKFKVTKSNPSWSNSTLYKVEITDETSEDLRPLRLRRITSANELKKSQPSTLTEFEEMFEERLFLTPGDIETKTSRQRFLYHLFDDILESLNLASKEKGVGSIGRVDVEMFMNHMYNILENHNAEFIGIYESWLYNRFRFKKANIHIANKEGVPYTKVNFKDRYTWLSEDVLKTMILDEFENASEGLQRQSMGNDKDESNLSIQDFKRLGPFTDLSPIQFEKLYDSALILSYESWLDDVKKSLNIRRAFKSSELEVLTKFHTQVGSTVRVNRNKFRFEKGRKIQISINSNNRVNLILDVINNSVYEASEKEAYDYDTGRSNPGRSKINLFEISNKKENFLQIHHLSGEDIKDTKLIEDPLSGTSKRESSKMFGFLNEAELAELDFALKSRIINGKYYTILGSSGDSDKLFIVEIERQFYFEPNAPSYGRNTPVDKSKEWFVDFWTKQYNDGFITEDHLKGIKEDIKKADMDSLFGGMGAEITYNDLAAEVSIYNAMQKVWPKYMMYGAANVFKRLKIPFTPVTYSKQMPSIRPVLFNPSDFVITYKGITTELVQNIGIFGPTYIGDGMSLTSRNVFNLYNKHFGLNKKMRYAKTVIYEKRGDNVVMFKHLQTGLRPGIEIKSKETGEVVWRVDKNGNIRDVSTGNIVDMLSTGDEIKVKELFDSEGISVNGGVQLEISGQSIGFIKFDDKPNKAIKSGVQIYNYENSEEAIDMFNQYYLAQLHNRLRQLFHLPVTYKDKKGKVRRHPGEAIASFIKGINKAEYVDGYSLSVLEHIKNGMGMYPQSFPFLNNFLQSKALLPAMQLEGQTGGRYKYRFDVTGLERGEIAITMDSNIINLYKSYGNKVSDLSPQILEDRINLWLSENPIYVKIQRYPVTSRASSLIVRVRNVHQDSKIIETHPFDAKEYLEMDADGDEVHVEYISGDILNVWQEIERTKEVEAINLNDFIKTVSVKSLLKRKDRISQIANSTVGAQAIGMIANIALAYGIMHNVYESFEAKGLKIKPRDPKDKLKWPVYWNKSLKKDKKEWIGTVEDFIRIWIQAAVDNAEYNLLGQWGFKLKVPKGEVTGQQWLVSNLFMIETSKGSNIYEPLNIKSNAEHKQIFQQLIFPILKQHIEAGRIRNGFDFQTGSHSLNDTTGKSDRYLGFVGRNGDSRVQGILNVQVGKNTTIGDIAALYGFKVNIKNKRLLPVESIAISSKLIQDEVAFNNGLEGYEATIFQYKPIVHNGAHAVAIDELESKILSKYLRNIMDKFNLSEEERNTMWDESLKEAEDYAVSLIKDWHSALKLHNQQGKEFTENSIDVDDLFKGITSGYDMLYKKLNPLEKALATIIYLRGYTGKYKLDAFTIRDDIRGVEIDIDVRVPRNLPPSSSDYRNVSLLDSKLLGEYFDIYNSIVEGFSSGKRPGRTGNNTAWNEIKRRVCN